MKLRIVNVRRGPAELHEDRAPHRGVRKRRDGVRAGARAHRAALRRQLSRLFFDQLRFPAPDVNLGVGSGSHAAQTAEIMIRWRRCLETQPTYVLVVGDVNSTIAVRLSPRSCASGWPTSKQAFAVATAQCRRRSTGSSRMRSATTSSRRVDAEQSAARRHPRREDLFVGNVMIDTLRRLSAVAEQSKIWDRLGLNERSRFLTCTGPATSTEGGLEQKFCRRSEVVQQELPFVFAVHPRTTKRLREFRCLGETEAVTQT